MSVIRSFKNYAICGLFTIFVFRKKAQLTFSNSFQHTANSHIVRRWKRQRYTSVTMPTSIQNTIFFRLSKPTIRPRIDSHGTPIVRASYTTAAMPSNEAAPTWILPTNSSLNAGLAATKNIPTTMKKPRN